MTKILFTIFSVFGVIAIAKQSIVWAMVIGAFLFCILCWLNCEPSKKPKYKTPGTSAREQQKLINRHEYET